MIQNDYVEILKSVIALNWDKNCIFLEDNDNAHSTCGKGDNKCKQIKKELGIKWKANPPDLPDLNPIERIWRRIKQRLKNWGVIWDSAELRRAIEEELDKITLDEINKEISTMPDYVKALKRSNGHPIPY